ncbi:hypothetical protein PPYR_07012 [Photinus pyralis]|uniref:Uncharacterized protein n=1 Tax=Photinus pyralis TaxID=7054 RepID=A0A5N4AP55_PHOPY|nr:hypothetical protein PPYR_07012 [Photinus pyralis]
MLDITNKIRQVTSTCKLQALLKRFSQGYEPKKSKILDLEQINRFIHEADDKHYLDTKVRCTSTHVESAVPSAIVEGNINSAEHNIITHNLPGIKVNTHDGAVTVKVYNNCTFTYADKDEI